jgi:anti-anti-sigma factor
MWFAENLPASPGPDKDGRQRLSERLTTVLNAGPSPLTVDLAGVTFLDSTGISVLVKAYNRATEDGIALSLTDCQRIVRRVLEVTGLLSVLTRDGGDSRHYRVASAGLG